MSQLKKLAGQTFWYGLSSIFGRFINYLLTPLLTIAFGTWLTGDAVHWPLIVGGTMAMIGVAIIVLRPARRLSKPQLVREP